MGSLGLEEARRMLNDPNAKLATPEDNVEECGYLHSQTLPDGLELMFSRGRLVRIDVSRASRRPAVQASATRRLASRACIRDTFR
jgi:hypothetical protein